MLTSANHSLARQKLSVLSKPRQHVNLNLAPQTPPPRSFNRFKMRFLHTITLLASVASAASQWGFDDAQVTVVDKKSEATLVDETYAKSTTQRRTDGYRFTTTSPLANKISLGETGSLKLHLTTKEGSKAKRPHQAFLLLQQPSSGLEAPFALKVRGSGKSTVEIVRFFSSEETHPADVPQTQKDIPIQLLLSETPLRASIVIGSFDSSSALHAQVFDVQIVADPNSPRPAYEAPDRFGKKDEIHHIFRGRPAQSAQGRVAGVCRGGAGYGSRALWQRAYIPSCSG